MPPTASAVELPFSTADIHATRPIYSKKWVLNATNDVGEWLSWPPGADVSFHCFGDAGAGGFNGATIKIQATAEDTPTEAAVVTAQDLQGSDMAFTANDHAGVGPVMRHFRPKVTVGALGADGVTIIAIMRRR